MIVNNINDFNYSAFIKVTTIYCNFNFLYCILSMANFCLWGKILFFLLWKQYFYILLITSEMWISKMTFSARNLYWNICGVWIRIFFFMDLLLRPPESFFRRVCHQKSEYLFIKRQQRHKSWDFGNSTRPSVTFLHFIYISIAIYSSLRPVAHTFIYILHQKLNFFFNPPI